MLSQYHAVKPGGLYYKQFTVVKSSQNAFWIPPCTVVMQKRWACIIKLLTAVIRASAFMPKCLTITDTTLGYYPTANRVISVVTG